MISAEALQSFPLFAKLDLDFIRELVANAEEVAYQKDIWLFYEGDEADVLYLIMQGSVDLKLILDKHKQTYVDLSRLDEGESFGWSAIVEPHVYRLGAVTAGNTHLVKINGQQLRRLMEQHPAQGYIMMHGIALAMASRLNAVRNRVPELSLRFVVSRILVAIAIIAGLLAILMGVGAIIIGDVTTFFMSLLCVMLPIGLLTLARFSYPETG